MTAYSSVTLNLDKIGAPADLSFYTNRHSRTLWLAVGRHLKFHTPFKGCNGKIRKLEKNFGHGYISYDTAGRTTLKTLLTIGEYSGITTNGQEHKHTALPTHIAEQLIDAAMWCEDKSARPAPVPLAHPLPPTPKADQWTAEELLARARKDLHTELFNEPTGTAIRDRHMRQVREAFFLNQVTLPQWIAKNNFKAPPPAEQSDGNSTTQKEHHPMSLFKPVLDRSPRIYGLRVVDHDNEQIIANLRRIAEQKKALQDLPGVSRAVAAQIAQCDEAAKMLVDQLDKLNPAEATAAAAE